MLLREQFLGGNFAYLKHTLAYFCRSMQSQGIRSIEFYAAAPHLYVPEATADRVAAVSAQLRAAGLSVRCFTAEQCNYPISLASSDPDTRARSVSYYERALDCAQELGSPLMQMISGIGLLEDDPEENLKRSVEGIAHIADLAEKKGIRIVLEADPNCSVPDTRVQMRVIREIGSPALTGMIDTNAVALNNEDFEEVVSMLGPHLNHVHFIDIDIPHGGFCLVPGEGTLPMRVWLDVLAKSGYAGGLTPEFWGTTYHDDAEGSMKRAFQFFSAQES